MKYIIIALAFMCSINNAQSQSLLKHYERNVEFSSIMLPNDAFKSTDFKIIYPDSIYDTADIIIKKAVFENLKKISLVLKTKDKIYTSIQLGTKSKKRFTLLKEMVAKKLACTVVQLESGTYVDEAINISIKKLGRHKIILLSQKR
jgi:hypothetical protein